MMNEKQKEHVHARLGRIEGQVRGVRRMIDEDRYCMDILAQTASIAAAMRGVEEFIMKQHLETCVADAMRSNDDEAKQEKIEEVMTAIARVRRHG